MNSAWNTLGLAMRAGKVVSGDEGVMKAIRSGNAKLVVLAGDASANAIKKYTDKCTYYGIPIISAGSREQLGIYLGKAERVAVAVTDAGFAVKIRIGLEQPEVE